MVDSGDGVLEAIAGAWLFSVFVLVFAAMMWLRLRLNARIHGDLETGWSSTFGPLSRWTLAIAATVCCLLGLLALVLWLAQD